MLHVELVNRLGPRNAPAAGVSGPSIGRSNLARSHLSNWSASWVARWKWTHSGPPRGEHEPQESLDRQKVHVAGPVEQESGWVGLLWALPCIYGERDGG